MVTSVTKGGTQKLPKQSKIVVTYWHDHSLESSWEALSDSTIIFSIYIYIYDTQKNQVALIGTRTTGIWIAGPLLYQLSYRGSRILCHVCDFFYTIFSDQLIILTYFPYMSGISPFRMRFRQVISDIMV
jgi:hypothetical protein